MTNLRECPECHRMVAKLTRGVCHTRCYRRHTVAGTQDTLPNARDERVKRADEYVEVYRLLMESNPELTQRQIAEKLGIHPSTLSESAIKRGVRKQHKVRSSGIGHVNYQSLVEDYWMLVESGETNKEKIARRLGVSERTLYRAFKAVGR